MTAENHDQESQSCSHSLSVKLRAGASLVKIKPLFTPNSKYILVASGCDIKVFSLSSGECILTFKKHTVPVVSIHINPQNNLQILSCSEDGTIFRWDYSDGKALKIYNLGFESKVVAFCAVPSCSSWFASVNIQGTNFSKVYSITMGKSKTPGKVKLLSKIDSLENSFSVGPSGNYIAGVFENFLLVHDLINNSNRKHLTGNFKLTCVTTHPHEYILATGDENGQIIVWSGFLESNHPVRSLYHWHSLSLPDLVFSPEGSHIYSAGNESVLVKWDLNSGFKQTLPRLGLPICLLAVSPDNKFIATAHVDNGLQIINSHNVIVQAIQGLTQGHYHKYESSETLPTGMLYDVRSKAIVMNGRPGHLQFYNILEDKQLFQLDIVGQNFMCQEREIVIVNTDVTKAAIDKNGMWLATVEYRDDGETSPDLRLKFWHFDLKSQKFVLNTNVFLPHNKKINCLKFQPESSEIPISEQIPTAVTTSEDNRFKIWTLSDNLNDKFSWSCEMMGYYKDMTPTEISFSEDGSLLCVLFEHVATLWSSETFALKTALNHPQSADIIQQVSFGRNKCCHLLAYHTDSMLVVWNVLSLSVLWSVSCRIQYLVADPSTDIMAAFTGDNNLFIFRPSDPKPLCVINKANKEPVISAVFVPHGRMEKDTEPCCWQCNSRLYFLNEKQELYALDDPESNEDESEKLILQPSMTYTPFGFLQAERTISDVKLHVSNKLVLDLSSEQPSEFLCPTNVNTVALCENVLQSLLSTKTRHHKEAQEERHRTNSLSKDSEVDSDSDTSVYEKEPKVEKMDTEVNVNHSSSVNFNSFKDYGFLIDFVT